MMHENSFYDADADTDANCDFLNRDKEVDGDKFIIDNDIKAEWAIVKIRDKKREMDRNVKKFELLKSYYCKFYDEEIEKEKNAFKYSVSHLMHLLECYMSTQPNNTTKTKSTYKLPSGTLEIKLPKEKMVYNDSELLEWIKNSNLHEFIKTKESVKWGDFKKHLNNVDGVIVMGDGEVVEPVMVEIEEKEFQIKFMEDDYAN